MLQKRFEIQFLRFSQNEFEIHQNRKSPFGLRSEKVALKWPFKRLDSIQEKHN